MPQRSPARGLRALARGRHHAGGVGKVSGVDAGRADRAGRSFIAGNERTGEGGKAGPGRHPGTIALGGAAYAAFLSWVDTLHSKGIHVVSTGDRNANNDSFREYNLATYFLFNDGHDFINGTQQTPRNLWPGFTADLGGATSPRVRSPQGLWTRSFSNGVVFTVEPGAPTQTIVLPAPMKTVSGETVSSVTLAAAHGAVVHN